MRRTFLAAVVAVFAGVAPATAQDHNFPTPGGALVDGKVEMCTDSSGNAVPVSNGTCKNPVAVSATQGTVSHASTTALGNSLVVKASAGTLYGFNCAGIAGGASGYCIAYNGTAAPGTGALTGANVLDFCFFDTTARGCSLYRNSPIAYSTGIVILVSSAASPYTYTTGTDTAGVTADFQ